MELGLHLSFAAKRWVTPRELAEVCGKELHIKKVQFTWDLLDPWWPEAYRDQAAREYKAALADAGVAITSTCAGLAACTYPFFLSPAAEERAIALDYYKRGADMSAAMGAEFMAVTLGGFSGSTMKNSEEKRAVCEDAAEKISELCAYAASVGVEAVHVEQSPARSEYPNTRSETAGLMEALQSRNGNHVRLLLDWGHVLSSGSLGGDADMEKWLRTCGKYIGSMHLQQTDGICDRHWAFDQEGILSRTAVESTLKKYGLENMVQYLELMFPYEQSNEQVLESMKRTIAILEN